MSKVHICPICNKRIEPANDEYVNPSNQDDDYRHAACEKRLRREQDEMNRKQGPPESY